ncbi:MAG: N(2)-acetyl-L-2,4-diaminobutanoate deacetylase DoeB [Pseudorhodobacter sp.]|nr:N(2)-acetyl-L-2,4-diaminobutanoate deacetylase DoeB [Pseudorhodobacter sp.]
MPQQNLIQSPITATVDFEADGVQHGFLRLPFSRDDAAWGSVMIPIAVVKNGSGSCALLTAGNHGDEYEGPIALYDLARNLTAEDVTGTVIIVPAMNTPAFQAGTRTSPIDHGNLNRLFPGRPDGSVTEKIADYFQRVLLPRADLVLDFHSGGKTLDFLPFCAAHVLADKEQEGRCIDLVRAFAAPWSVRMLEIDAVGQFDTAAETMGKIFVTTELGGGGTATARSAGIAKRGVRNVLRAAGILKGSVEPAPTRWLDMPDADCFTFAEDAGLIAFLVNLGDEVVVGQPLAQIVPTGRTGLPIVTLHARRSGLFTARHFPGLVKAGDCVAVVATEIDG